MSEQETNEQEDAPPAVIDWSNEKTPAEDLPITHAEQLQEGAKDCTHEMFAGKPGVKGFLEAYATAVAADDRLGIMFIKAGVEECTDVKEQAKRRKLISKQLQEMAKTLPVAPTKDSPATFEMLLKGFADAEADDKEQSIALIKAAVAGEGVEEQAAKKALVAVFEEMHFAVEQEEAPAADEQEVVQAVAPAKAAAPAKTSAADKKEISDIKKAFDTFAARATARIEALELRVISQAAEIETLKSGRIDPKALEKLTEKMETVEEGVVTLFNDVSERVKPLEEAAAAKAAKDKQRINTFGSNL